MAKVDVKVPDIGDFSDVPVIEVLVKPGDVVKAEQSLVTLESDKAAMDVPSPVEGAVAEVLAKVGDKVSMGTLIARIDSGESGKAEAAPAKAAAPAAPAPEKSAAASAKEAAAPTPKAASPAPAKAATIDITIPDIGDFKDVPVIEILVKAGDTVEAEQPIVTLESDKASMDVPSPAAGKITEIVVKVGDKVSMGSVVGKLESSGQAAQASSDQDDEADAKEEEDAAEAPDTSPVGPSDLPPRPPKAGAGPALPDFSGVFAGPAVRRLARELGLDLNQLKGTGEKGRITREDVKAALARGTAAPAASGGGALPAVPQVDFAKFGPIETVPLSRIKKISGPRLHASWVNIPHVTHTDEADITDLDAFRKALDEDAKKDKSKPYRVSLLPLLMRAAVVDAEGLPELQRRSQSCRRLFDFAPLLAHRRRRGHARWPRRRGHQGRRPEGRRRPFPRARRPLGKSARRQACAGRNAGGDLHHLFAGRHRRHRLHARSSTRPKSRFLASCVRKWLPFGTERRFSLVSCCRYAYLTITG